MDKTRVAKRRIDLTPRTSHVHSAQYREAPKILKVYRFEIARMLEQETIQSTRT